VLVCAGQEEAGGCADCAGEGAVVALLSDLDDGDWPDVMRSLGHRCIGFGDDWPVVVSAIY